MLRSSRCRLRTFRKVQQPPRAKNNAKRYRCNLTKYIYIKRPVYIYVTWTGSVFSVTSGAVDNRLVSSTADDNNTYSQASHDSSILPVWQPLLPKKETSWPLREPLLWQEITRKRWKPLLIQQTTTQKVLQPASDINREECNR